MAKAKRDTAGSASEATVTPISDSFPVSDEEIAEVQAKAQAIVDAKLVFANTQYRIMELEEELTAQAILVRDAQMAYHQKLNAITESRGIAQADQAGWTLELSNRVLRRK